MAALGQAVRGRTGRSNFRVHWDPSLPQVHTQHVLVQQGLPRFSNEVSGSLVFVPSICFPFHPFPPSYTHTLCFLFSFMSSCLHVLSSHPFFFCAHIGPGLSVYVHFYIHLQPRFQVAQVLIMRWDSSVVPVHLVPLSSQLRTFPSCLVFSSCLHLFVFAACACAHLPLP